MKSKAQRKAKPGFKSVQAKKVWRGRQFANDGQTRLRTKGEASISTERVTQSVRMRFNPLRGLTPDRLGQYLDQFDLGFFRFAAITWDKLERRDPTLKSVVPKRKKAVARHGFEILTVNNVPDEAKALAKQQVEALTYFYNNLNATDALKPDQRGGLSLLARQMMDAQGKYYAVHEIVWLPSDNGLTAQFVFCPLWWFEGTIGKLRYLENEFNIYGKDMVDGEWLITTGEGIMEASSVAWIFKNLTMQDWLAYCEKFGTPFIDAATSESPGSEGWEALKEYVENFGPDGGGVRSNNSTINPIEVKGQAEATFSKMVENMNRALTILWRGGDLSTTSGKDQAGASLQGDEADILEGDDAVLIEETLGQQVSRVVIAWRFGPDAPVLAYLKFRQAEQQNVDADIKVDQFLLNAGAPLEVKTTLERYGRPVPADGALLLKPVAKPGPQDDKGNNPESADKPEITNSKPDEELIDNGVEHYAQAVAHDLEIVREELEAISRVDDDRVFAQRAVSFKDKLDALKKDLLHLPKAAQALAEVMIAGLMTGLTEGPKSKLQKPTTEMANGDLPGHEFHGNQYREAGEADIAEYKRLRGEADAAHIAAHEAEYGKDSKASHEEISAAHKTASEKYKTAAKHMAQFKGTRAGTRLMRQKAADHKFNAAYHAQKAKEQKQ